MEKKINWGILGPGKIAHRWAEGLKLLNEARLHSVGSRDISRARDFATEHGFKNYYGSYGSLVADSELDIIYVASPHSHHMEHTILCLESGISVVCEKAFAINSREVRLMIDKAKENNLFLMEALWPPFQPSYAKAKELLEVKGLGEILSLRSYFAFIPPYEPDKRLYNTELGGGALLDIGIYPVIDALTFLGTPSGVEARASFDTTGADDNIDIDFSYDNGKRASLSASLRSDAGTGTDITCENGLVSLRRFQDGTQLTSLKMKGRDVEEYIFAPEARGFHYEAAEAMKQIKAGKKESAIVPLSFSVELMATLDLVRQKAGIVYPGRD